MPARHPHNDHQSLGHRRNGRAVPLKLVTSAPQRVTSQSDLIPSVCLAVFTALWVGLAIEPRYPEDWLLENLLTFACVPAAVLTYRRFRFTDQAYVQAALFLILHIVGSHYTYSHVPLGDWALDVFGFSRNHYDRLVPLLLRRIDAAADA